MNYWERKKIFISIGIILLALLYSTFAEKEKNVVEQKGKAINFLNKTKPPKRKLCQVQITGAVLNPGIYAIPEGYRVKDAVKEAGGLTVRADKDKLNQVKKIKDGMLIKVPFLEIKKDKLKGKEKAKEKDTIKTREKRKTEKVIKHTKEAEQKNSSKVEKKILKKMKKSKHKYKRKYFTGKRRKKRHD